jgi:hypothetical protein
VTPDELTAFDPDRFVVGEPTEQDPADYYARYAGRRG